MGSLPHVVEDCMGFLQLLSDGSIFRSNDIEFKVSPFQDTTIAFKDFLFHKRFNLSLRLYKPQLQYDGKLKLKFTLIKKTILC